MDEAISYINNATKASAVKKLKVPRSTELVLWKTEDVPGTKVTLILYVDVFSGEFKLPQLRTSLFI